MKKLISLLLALTLVLSSVTAFAAFPDLEDSKWDWARESIDEMTDKGIIAGYPDGNFGPADGVTKLQALLLMSRILGFYEEEMQTTVEKAKEIYGSALESYDISNTDEIAFLLYYGAIKESELPDYLGDSGDVIKRYEAAILLTKTAGAEEEVLSGGTSTLTYTDAGSIPSNAKRYVKYVGDKGYMVGMTETTFEPNENVTRAQMAAMLYRIMKNLDITYNAGEFVSLEGSTLTLLQDGEKNPYTVKTGDALIRVDGNVADKDALPVGGYTVIKSYAGKVLFIDAFIPDVDESVTGTVTSITSGASKSVKITPIDNSESRVIFVEDTAIITLNGAKSNYAEIKRGDMVTISVVGGKGKTVDIALREEVINGAVFKSVSYSPYATVTFKTSDGEEVTKILSPEVSVARNNKLTELTELIPGDKLIVSLEKGFVTKIKATSIKSEIEGTIETIHISTSPYIVVKSDGESIEYSLAKNVAVNFEETTGTIYDLRLGNFVSLEIESDTVKSISSIAPEAEANTITGVVEGINVDYNFFYINVPNAQTGGSDKVQVFVKKSGGTKFVDSMDGSMISLGKMKEGSTAFVTGVKQLDGSYVATTVVIIGG